MAKLNILEYPDPRLRQRAEAVPAVDEEVRQFADDMVETMYEARGIGLAAVQVGDARRVVVIDVSEERNEPRVLINPEIVESTGEVESEEGCLSIPGVYDRIQRAERVRYRAQDRDGNAIEGEADGLLAVCIQHEIDHLDGRLFIDYLSELKRSRIRKKLKKQRQDSA